MDDTESKSVNGGVARHMPTQRREIAAQAIKELWQELKLDGNPLIFASPVQGKVQLEHHPLLLDQLITNNKQRKKSQFGQLKAWELLSAPSYAQGIAVTGEVSTLLKADMLRPAEIGERGTIPGAPYSWICYSFNDDWQALSVYFYDSDNNDAQALTAIPNGRQDEWLAFLKLLDDLYDTVWRGTRRGYIEIIGGSDELAEVMRKASFDDVVLNAETLEHVAAQRRIFDKEILNRYESLRLPRLRKVLLIGPSGTGKTTLLKAEGAYHAKQGGLVCYVCPPPYNRNTSAWQQLTKALHIATESQLPSLILVEDFEVFVSNPPELQQVLNILDGVATPDNPAGTLLLATSNDPEKIDQRIRDRPGRIDALIEIGLVEDTELAIRFLRHFLGSAYREEEHGPIASQLLKQPGSHFREVCIAATMRALEKGRSEVTGEDLLWAHETILTGQAIAAEAERFTPPPTHKRGGYFGRKH
jgi:energy-coupling factor transporter ATP-binding protein EcfA2